MPGAEGRTSTEPDRITFSLRGVLNNPLGYVALRRALASFGRKRPPCFVKDGFQFLDSFRIERGGFTGVDHCCSTPFGTLTEPIPRYGEGFVAEGSAVDIAACLALPFPVGHSFALLMRGDGDRTNFSHLSARKYRLSFNCLLRGQDN